MKKKPFMTYAGEILFKLLRSSEILVPHILKEHYLADGVTAVIVHGRDSQKYRVTIQPLYEYFNDNGVKRARKIVEREKP